MFVLSILVHILSSSVRTNSILVFARRHGCILEGERSVNFQECTYDGERVQKLYLGDCAPHSLGSILIMCRVCMLTLNFDDLHIYHYAFKKTI